MATTIQIDEQTKAMLDRLKIHYRQSYNELISNIAAEKMKRNTNKNIMALAGAWKNIDNKEIEEMKSTIHQLRRRSTTHLFGKMEKQ